MTAVWVRVSNWLRREEGQALSEYGVIVALILVASIGAIIAFREELRNVLTDATTGLKSR